MIDALVLAEMTDASHALTPSPSPTQPSPPPLSQRERGDSCGCAEASARGEMSSGADAPHKEVP